MEKPESTENTPLSVLSDEELKKKRHRETMLRYYHKRMARDDEFAKKNSERVLAAYHKKRAEIDKENLPPKNKGGRPRKNPPSTLDSDAR